MLVKHGLATLRAQDFVRGGRGSELLTVFISWYWKHETGDLFLQSGELGSLGSAKEAIVTNLHKVVRQDMLEEALDEFFSGEGTLLELTLIGGTVGEGDLGRGHVAGVGAPDQAPIAEGDAVNVGSQVLEGCLSIAHRLAVHDPIFGPGL